jgi:hypothetical protein
LDLVVAATAMNEIGHGFSLVVDRTERAQEVLGAMKR